jgi:hypothetical protein
MVLAAILGTWGVLELSYRSLLGDVSWLDAPPAVHVEPQARQVVLTLMFHQRQLEEGRSFRWVVPIWRFVDPWWWRHRPADELDLARRIGGPWCLHEPVPTANGLKRSLEELARTVWIARHWDEERMVDAWASCVADRLAACGVKISSTPSLFDAAYLWSHDTGQGRCRERRVDRRLNAAVEALWLEAPDLEEELLEELHFWPAPADERPR